MAQRPGPQSPLSGRAPPQKVGGIFPKFTVFIPKNREYLAQLSVPSTRKKFGVQKASGCAKKDIEGVPKNQRPLFSFLDIQFFGGAIWITPLLGALLLPSQYKAKETTYKAPGYGSRQMMVRFKAVYTNQFYDQLL